MNHKEAPMRRIFHPALVLVGYLLVSGYSGCDPIIENNGFDLWCGDKLCSWETETGSIARVPTWHKNDFGVDLVGNAAAISQLSDITQRDFSCIRFDLVAKIDEAAVVTLELDFYDDGSVDWSRTIPTSDWASLTYLITMPREYEGVRFRLKKVGSGRAVVAQLQADGGAGKCVEPPVQLGPKPLGASCWTGGSPCASGLCADSVCSACETDDDCDAGDVCGAEARPGAGHLGVYRSCGPVARHGLGERCVGDSECSTGLCGEFGMCETCVNALDCPDGEQCARLGVPGLQGAVDWIAPRQCSPDAGLRSSGEACLIDSDCAANSCVGDGILRVCELEGRTCSDDKDCPNELACVPVGTTRGQCQ